jgi:hypothetical protein
MRKCKPQPSSQSKSGPETILAIGDLHSPFMHRDAVRFLAALVEKYRPSRVVCLGDVADQHAFSRHPKDPAGYSGGDELKAARKQLRKLYEVIPDANVCEGNHDRRIYQRAEEVGIPVSALHDMNRILDCPAGWEWREHWEFDGVVYEHGDGFTGRDAHTKCAAGNMQNTVIGHIHAHAGIQWVANRKHLFFGFNVGCLIDHAAYAFAYARKTVAKPIIGAGIVVGGVPSFVPMNLSKGGRWRAHL